MRKLIVIAAFVAVACGKPNGLAEFKTSYYKMQSVDHMTIDWTTKNAVATFHETAQIDCGGAQPYYHYREVRDYTPEGISSNTTLTQGRPRAHQENERLFVGGKSFIKSSAQWERGDDSYDWHGSSSTFDPSPECAGLRGGKDPMFLPFSKILGLDKVEYVGKDTVDGAKCHDFRVTVSEMAYTDTWTTTDLGNGNSASERQAAPKNVDSTICIGVDDLLPHRIVKPDITATYSYAKFDRLEPPN